MDRKGDLLDQCRDWKIPVTFHEYVVGEHLSVVNITSKSMWIVRVIELLPQKNYYTVMVLKAPTDAAEPKSGYETNLIIGYNLDITKLNSRSAKVFYG